MRNRIRPAWPGARVAAPAFPVECTPGDNLAIHVGVARAPPRPRARRPPRRRACARRLGGRPPPAGPALVASVGDGRELGYWGEVLTTAAEARALAGLVIDGCVR